MKMLTYCPRCGHTLGQREDGGRLRQACDNCGYIHYVNPVPVVGILIEMDGGIVLIRRGQPPHQGEWTLPSGFIEADESAEEAAMREAEEETGLNVELLELFGINSFPEGPPVSGIILFFRAKPVRGELHGGDDALEAKVFQPEDMPLLPFRTHREIMGKWLDEYAAGARALHSLRSRASPLPTQTSDFLIRPAESQDSDEIIALLQTIPANRDLSPNEWDHVALRIREAAGVEVFVAQTHAKPALIIGCAALSIVRTLTEGRGFINDMAVLPTYQRQGIGAALLEAVVLRARRLNLQQIMVNSERANPQARAFYSASGFAEGQIMMLRLR